MASIGFIGLGHMGFPMAVNLMKAGHSLSAFDIQTDVLERFSALGGKPALNIAEAVENQSIIITMLQTGPQVAEVCLGSAGVFAHAAPGSLYIDSSTIDVETSRRLHEAANRHKLASVDAPVSGGVTGAIEASLTFMIGGLEEACNRAEPILAAMGKKQIRTGGPGSGQAAKICNNMILGVSMVAISEAFLLAEALGLSAEKLFEVVNSSSGQCWAMSHYPPVQGLISNAPANHQYQPGFASKMMLKDLRLSQKAAGFASVETPLAAQATDLYEAFCGHGLGHLDFSAIIQTLTKKSVHDT
ncbi:MAG: 3-hydroxyisobutyrate dehydrogenase [Legionella sp.]|nr:3-hydroxyisobutyrate dehydrogenase [Legionella sp.]